MAGTLCAVCTADAIVEDDSGALVCAVCGTQVSDFVNVTQEDEGVELTGTRYKRKRSLSEPLPSPLPLKQLHAAGDTEEARFRETVEAAQCVLGLQSTALAVLFGLDAGRVHREVGRIWATYLCRGHALQPLLYHPAPRAPLVVNITVVTSVAFVGACVVEPCLLLREVVDALEDGRLPYLGAHARLPETVPSRLRGPKSSLRPKRHLLLAAWEKKVAVVWRLAAISGPAPLQPCLAPAASRMAAAAQLPRELGALAQAADDLLSQSKRRPQRLFWRSFARAAAFHARVAGALLTVINLCYMPRGCWLPGGGCPADAWVELQALALPSAADVLAALVRGSIHRRYRDDFLSAKGLGHWEYALLRTEDLSSAAKLLTEGSFAADRAPKALEEVLHVHTPSHRVAARAASTLRALGQEPPDFPHATMGRGEAAKVGLAIMELATIALSRIAGTELSADDYVGGATPAMAAVIERLSRTRLNKSNRPRRHSRSGQRRRPLGAAAPGEHG